MWTSPAAIAAQLRQQDWDDLYAPVEAAVKEHEVSWILALLGELSGDTAPHVCSFRDLVIEGLALVPGAIRPLVAHTPAAYFAPPQHGHADLGARRLGARLGQAQPADVLFGSLWLAERPRWRDVFACWVQEKVIRGHDLREDPALVAFWSAQAHPLAAMPLRRLPLEILPNRYHHRYHVTGASGWGCPPMLMPDTPRLPEGGAPPASENTTTPSQHADIGACYESARAVSNGRSEAAVFRLAAPVSGLSRQLIASLRLRCFSSPRTFRDEPEPVPAQQPIEAQPTDARASFAVLLSEAANGGCYNRGWSAAWGRRNAWRSLAGLVGVQGSLETVAAAAERCQWASFRVRSGWFWGIMADPAIVCLRPGGQTVAIFAGTDSD